jgi:surface carbohydrate biosynthesis protein (TIGR04326 family)
LTRGAPLLLWAGDAGAAPTHSNLLLWEGPAKGQNARLLSDYLETNADQIRRRYLAWAHDLGNQLVGGARLRESFRLADGVDLWSLSVFVEQSPWRQKSVEPILKVMAFELLLEREAPDSVHYHGPDADLGQVLEALCRRCGVRYDFTRRAGSAGHDRMSLRRRLPQPLQAMLALIYLAVTYVPMRAKSCEPGAPHRRRVLISGSFFNHNGTAIGRGSFESRFWTTLPAALEAHGCDITWLHVFYGHAEVPTVSAAARMIRRINRSAAPRGTHLLLESFLTPRGLCRVAARGLAVAARSIKLARALKRAFAQTPSQTYWPLLKADWAKAFRGAGCIENLVYAECFDRALASLPKQDEGLHMMECQGWERALAQAWSRRGHGRLAGVIHSTIRYWDLRYHCDPRRYDPGALSPPRPNVVIVNGRAAAEAYESTCPNRERLADGEALRYLQLVPRPPVDISEVPSKGTLQVLVLGDYVPEGTESVMRLMEDTFAALELPVSVRVKPHPNCPVDPQRFSRMHFSVVNGSVAALALEAHIVLSGNLTSAAVDAHVCGARVLVHDDGRGLNYSPLRGTPGVTFVRNAAELCVAIRKLLVTKPADGGTTRDFFYIDPTLPRWRRYFGIADIR